MTKILNFLFSWGFFVFAIALGVALWFAINYVDTIRLESSFYDIGEIFMMTAVSFFTLLQQYLLYLLGL